MTNSPADVVRWMMVSSGLGVDPASAASEPWPVYYSAEPDKPDACVTTYDTEGQAFGRDMVTGDFLTHYGVQVRFRGSDDLTGRAKAEAVRNYFMEKVWLRTVVCPTPATYLVHCMSKVGNVLSLGKDSPSTRRSLFTLNATVALTQLS